MTLSTSSFYFLLFCNSFRGKLATPFTEYLKELENARFLEQNETLNDRRILHARLPAKVDKNLFPIFTLEPN